MAGGRQRPGSPSLIPDGGLTQDVSAPPSTVGFTPPPTSDRSGEIPPPDPVSYSTDFRDQYREVRSWARDAYGFSSVADLDSRTKWAAEKFKNERGYWPSATELWSYSSYHETLNLLASGRAYMNPYFGIWNEDGSTTWVENTQFEWREADAQTAWFMSGGDLVQNQMTAGFMPDRFTTEQLFLMTESMSPISGAGGSGGSGGAGREPMAFDRAQLAEEATNRWRGLLLEEPDQATLDSIVGDYISEANAFWMKEAGRLDYDTFVVDRVRATNRHTSLYEKKPEFQSEAEYMGGFRQTVGQFGFNDRAALRETEAGAHSGAGLAGFGERVGRTAEARLASTGSYSQRFAASMADSGLGST